MNNRRLRVAIAMAVLMGSCSTPAVDRAVVGRTPTACPEPLPPLPATTSAIERPDLQVPGHALFVDDAGQMFDYSGGSARRIAAPYPVLQSSARLTPEGRPVALVAGPASDAVAVWSSGVDAGTDRIVQLPTTFIRDSSIAVWSPSTSSVAYLPSFGARLVYVVGPAGNVQQAQANGEPIYGAIWRNDQELTLVTASQGTGFPLSDATLWALKPPLQPIRMVGPITMAAYPQWSPDGRLLALLEEVDSDRAVRLYGDQTLLLTSGRDLGRAGRSCTDTEVHIDSIGWSPDSRTLAIVGRRSQYVVAFASIADGSLHVLATPTAPNCYIPGRIAWSPGRALVPLFGPDCGLGESSLGNAIAVIDSSTFKFQSYVAITRKGFLANAGAWIAITAGPDGKATTFLSLTDPSMRKTIPHSRLVDYCCTP